VTWLLVVVGLCSLYTQRRSYIELRTTKQIYAGLVARTSEAAERAPVVLTDLWWLDSVVAALSPRVQFLYVGNFERARSAVRLLDGADTEAFVIGRRDGESQAGRPEAWLAGSSFRVGGTTTLDLPAIELYAATR